MTTATVAGSAPVDASGPSVPQQAGLLLTLAAGYVGHRTITMGIRAGLISWLAESPSGSTPGELARATGSDPFYTAVWCRAAFAAGVCDREGTGFTDARYRLAPHVGTLLLDAGSPAFVGGAFVVLEQYEVLTRFEEVLSSGERMWWSDTRPEWIAAVTQTGRPFYTRLIPDGLDQVPGLAARLATGARVFDTSCGTGEGLARLAAHYPRCTIAGTDGDAHSTAQARQRLDALGLPDVELITSPLEELEVDEPFTLVINNISMHECRDLDEATARIRRALEPGGWFVISDFPFPVDEKLRTPPGRVMSGIQFFEAQIDDQLLPREAYDELLERHGFIDRGSVQLTPMHALTYGRA